MRGMLVLAVLLAGCVDGNSSGDPSETATTTTTGFSNIAFSHSVQTIGTGVPTVQCPADQFNSQIVTWTVTTSQELPANATLWATDMVFTLTGTPTVNDVDMFVTGPDGNSLGSGTGPTAAEEVTAGGQQPLGDYQIELRGCSGAGEVVVNGHASIHWAYQETS